MKRSVITYLITLILAVGILLGLTFGLQGVAEENARQEHLRILRTLLPGSENFEIEPYSGEDANIRSVHKGENGFVIETVTAGYVDEITLLIGVSNAGKVTGLMVRDMHETYGLGGNAMYDWEFLMQFLCTTGDAQVGDGVDAITGATVTSKAIARGVNSAVAYVTGADAGSAATSWGG